MPLYRYRVKNQAGHTCRDIRSAESEAALFNELREEGCIPLQIRISKGNLLRIRLGLKDTRELSAMLALLLDSGHTIHDSLKLVISVKESNKIGRACKAWSQELDRGASFRKALDSAPIALPASFKSLTGIGETVGSLGSVLKQLEEYYARLSKLKERMSTALIYPLLVLLVALIVGVIITTVILPKMTEMLMVLNPGASTPENSTTHLAGFISGLALFIIVSVFILPFSRESTPGRWRSRVLLNLPLIGSFIKNWGLLSWSFAMEILSEGGVTMDRALMEAAAAAGNSRLVSALAELPGQLGKGHSLSSLLSGIPYVPEIVPAWIAIGEQTGKDTEVFKPIRRYFEDRVSRSIDLATQLMEPVLILSLGAGMVFFVLRYLMPFFRMMGNLL